jgi:ABC-type nickel/cobalt efflux system permease component RcnA
LEGGLKEVIHTLRSLNRFILFNDKSLIVALLAAIMKGLTAFVLLLISLGLFELVQAIISGKQRVILDKVDFAIAGLGFLLMFAEKLLERLYGKY